MRLAEARLAASTMISCSMIASLTGLLWLWTMKTSAPRMDSPNRQYISPLANWERLVSPRVTPRAEAMALASSGLERPVKSSSRFLVTSSIVGCYTLSSSPAVAV